MDRQTLIRAMGNDIISDEECAAFNAAMIQADCTNVNRAAMFCAQIGHESVGLRYYEEIASGAAYEGRGDLGNTQPGDGVRFKGRGPIQVTGRRNYDVLSQWAFGKGYVDRPDAFVADPALLSEIRYGFLGAVWYWTTQRPLNDLSDRRDLDGATRAINGGLNGIDDRRSRYNRCLPMGEALLPEGDDMPAAEEVQRELKGPDGQGWPVELYDKPGERRTLVAMTGNIFTKMLSKLSLVGRPVDPTVPDDLLGHVLSHRAEGLQLKAMLTKALGNQVEIARRLDAIEGKIR